MKRPKLTAKEVAEIVREALLELPPELVQAKTDWVIECMERAERDENDTHARMFQRVRAELFRLGVRHTNQL